MTKKELLKRVSELNEAVKDLRAAIKENDWEYASLSMDDVEGIGAQIREELDTK